MARIVPTNGRGAPIPGSRILRCRPCDGLRNRSIAGVENGGVLANPAVPARALYVQTKVIRTATASERPSVGPGRARDDKPARIPLWPPGQHEVPINEEPRDQPARPETQPNQRLYVPLGSPPLIAVGSPSTHAAHRSCAPQIDILESELDGDAGRFQGVVGGPPKRKLGVGPGQPGGTVPHGHAPPGATDYKR